MQAFKDYVLRTNPWGVAESEESGVLKRKIKDADLKTKLGFE